MLGRSPRSDDVERSRAFLAEYQTAQAELDAAAGARAPVVLTALPVAQARPKRQPENPDEADQTAEPISEPIVRGSDARAEAWLALAQALFGTAEFRYIR